MLTALAAALTTAPASAATFSYSLTNVPLKRESAGQLEAVSTTYDDVSQLFTWSSTLSPNVDDGTLAEGAWLVVNDGPNPRIDVKEQVIFYLDGLESRVFAYVYNGKKGPRTWQDAEFLGSQLLSVSNDGDNRIFSFDWNMANINQMTDTLGAHWKGTAFSDEIGIWFHAIEGYTAAYDTNNKLTEFSFDVMEQTSFDVGGRSTVRLEDVQPVPEPGMAIALGLTAATGAMFSTSRRRLA